MSQTNTTKIEPESVDAPPMPKATPTPASQTNVKREVLPPHAVLLHNDDVHAMEHVVVALMRVFHYSLIRSARLMLRAHFAGQVVVWTGPLEVAELKAEQLQEAGVARPVKNPKPLRVSVEPMPG